MAEKLLPVHKHVIDSRKALRDRPASASSAGYASDYGYVFVPEIGVASIEGTEGLASETGSHNAHTHATPGASERRFRQLADAMPQIVWTATPEGALDYANQQLTSYSGLPPEAALGGGWLNLVHPEDREHAVARWRRSLATGEFYDTEFRIGAADGSWRYHLVRAHATRNESGEIAHWFGTCTDIQHQKDAARELAAARDRSSSILESITDAFCALDNRWCFTYLNKAAERILQRSREELLGKHLWTEFAPPVPSIFESECRRAVEEGVPVQFEEFYPPLQAWLAVHAYPSPEGLTLYFQDVGEHKKAEMQREHLMRELARSNAELEVFAHVAAHDLQSPLRMVRIYTQLLEAKLKDHLDESGRALMCTILDGADRMQQLVQALLSYARVGQEQRETLPVAMGSIVAEALAQLSPLIEEAGAHVAVADLPTVQGDGVQLLQLLQNLISNAIKYRRRDARLKLSILATAVRGEWVFEVRDNGQGVPAAYRDLVFEPLKRLHGHDVPGTGIGLAVCRKIVQRHGGRIWVEPAPDEGSSFLFTLPA